MGGAIPPLWNSAKFFMLSHLPSIARSYNRLSTLIQQWG